MLLHRGRDQRPRAAEGTNARSLQFAGVIELTLSERHSPVRGGAEPARQLFERQGKLTIAALSNDWPVPRVTRTVMTTLRRRPLSPFHIFSSIGDFDVGFGAPNPLLQSRLMRALQHGAQTHELAMFGVGGANPIDATGGAIWLLRFWPSPRPPSTAIVHLPALGGGQYVAKANGKTG